MEQFIRQILKEYDIVGDSIEKLDDTSRNDEDIRQQYLINHSYVMKLNTAALVSEKFLDDISRVIERYRKIGVWVPRLIRKTDGKFLAEMEIDGRTYYVYVEEYAIYKIAKDVKDEDKLKREIMEHIGVLAAEYSGVDLMETPSMWTILDLHPLDKEVDESQDNLNRLITVLKEKNREKEIEILERENKKARQMLQKWYRKLPRCVYQGDLNFTNVLINDEEEFKGLIDFNMAGTEVNINNFLHETAYFLQEEDFVELSAEEIYDKMNEKQELLMEIILRNYSLNEDEKRCLPLYKKIIGMSFYPNVMLWIYLLQNGKYVDKVLELLLLIAEEAND